MKLNTEQHREEYDQLQDVFYLEKIKSILQYYSVQERIDRDFDAMQDFEFPRIQHFLRMCAGRPRFTLRPAAPVAMVASCPMM